MGYEIMMGQNIIGTFDPHSGKTTYDDQAIKANIKEMVAGQSATGGFVRTNVRVVYRWDRNRKENNTAIYRLWKSNPIAQNRIRQLNSLVFGRGFSYSYDSTTKQVVDRFWSVNKLRRRLNPMCTDAQLYGETFIGLFPQANGDVLVSVYESADVDIDFNPSNVDDINSYIVSYKDEEKNQDMTLKFLPAYKYINSLDTQKGNGKLISGIRRILGKSTPISLSGFDGVMVHIKFNNSSSEIHGTSDFRQTYAVISDYMDFRSDRMAIQEMYGSPSFDIAIDTDDPNVIANRIDELAGFTLGSNPVHNAHEKWTPLEFSGNPGSAEYDEKAMRGLICAGTGFPEHLLFNQSSGVPSEDGTFALNKLAEDMQDAFGDAIVEMHKFVVSVNGGDITKIDQGQLIFPEISTMSEKAKAETYVLKVGANICSRKTAAFNTGHNWDIEQPQMLEEAQMFNPLAGTQEGGGIMGGRFSTRVGNQDPNADHGDDDREARANANNISTQTFGNRKTNN